MKSNILVSPLNWGLGHAVRCIPIIKCLIERGHEVSIASDGEAFFLLKNEFPDLRSFELPSLHIKYPRIFRTIFWLRQLPRLKKWIQADKSRIKELSQKYSFTSIISDNRYGVFYKGCRNVFITHQLHLQIPFPFRVVASMYLHEYINKFDLCLIPDYRNKPNLAGELCHPSIKIPTIYSGPYSRFKYFESEIEFDIVAIISGPEPHRSEFENRITGQLRDADLKVLIVRGKPGSGTFRKLNISTSVVDFLISSQLNEIVSRSAMVVSRAGYSSIMDYHVMKKKALLIPTPGQPEQEYLAIWNKDHPLFLFQEESKLDISSARKILLSREEDVTRNLEMNDFGFIEEIGF